MPKSAHFAAQIENLELQEKPMPVKIDSGIFLFKCFDVSCDIISYPSNNSIGKKYLTELLRI